MDEMDERSNNRTNTLKSFFTSKRWTLALAGVALFLAGLVAGGLGGGTLFAFAASPQAHTTNATPAPRQTTLSDADIQDLQEYCQVYEQTVAKELNVSPDALEKANADGLQAAVDNLAKEGKITAAQKTQIEQALAQIRTQPCDHLGQILKQNGTPTASQTQAFANARTAVLGAVAGALKLSPDALNHDLTNGQTIPALAQTQGVKLDDVNTAYLGAVKTQLAQAVSGGSLTQGQSDQFYAVIQSAVQAGHYPLLERGAGLGA